MPQWFIWQTHGFKPLLTPRKTMRFGPDLKLGGEARGEVETNANIILDNKSDNT